MNIEIYIDEVTDEFRPRSFYIDSLYLYKIDIETKYHQDEIVSIDDAKKIQLEIFNIFLDNIQSELTKFGIPSSANRYKLVYTKIKLLNEMEVIIHSDGFVIKRIYIENRYEMYNKKKSVPKYIIQKYRNNSWEDEVVETSIEKYKNLDKYHRILERKLSSKDDDNKLYKLVL